MPSNKQKGGEGHMKKQTRTHVEETLTANYQKYYRLAYSYVKNEADALDIVQESAYKAIMQCSKLKNTSYADTWIYRIVINTATDFLRKKQKTVVGIESHFDLEKEQSAEESGYANADIMDTLSMLEEKDRSVLILRYFEQFQLDQIADITGEKLSTVKSRLYRALEKLRICMEIS